MCAERSRIGSAKSNSPIKKRAEVITKDRIKIYVRASEALAQLLRMDWLPEAYVPSGDIRELRELLGRRVSLADSRAKYKNKIQAELSKHRIILNGLLGIILG